MRRAFTFIELVVVIGLIILLVGLVLSVSVSVVAGSERRETERVINLLDTAVKEWEARADRKVSWGIDGQPSPPGTAHYDMQNGTPHVLTVTELLATIGRNDAVRSIIAQIPTGLVHTYDSQQDVPAWIATPDPGDPDLSSFGTAQSVFTSGSIDGQLAILDAWDEPIRVVHPGARQELFPSAVRDADGTVRVDAGLFYGTEEYYGVGRNRQILFVSAGPDGRFGNLSAAQGTSLLEQAGDNVASYEPIDP